MLQLRLKDKLLRIFRVKLIPFLDFVADLLRVVLLLAMKLDILGTILSLQAAEGDHLLLGQLILLLQLLHLLLYINGQGGGKFDVED